MDILRQRPGYSVHEEETSIGALRRLREEDRLGWSRSSCANRDWSGASPCSSAVHENGRGGGPGRRFHTAGVSGSSPLAPTIRLARYAVSLMAGQVECPERAPRVEGPRPTSTVSSGWRDGGHSATVAAQVDDRVRLRPPDDLGVVPAAPGAENTLGRGALRRTAARGSWSENGCF